MRAATYRRRTAIELQPPASYDVEYFDEATRTVTVTNRSKPQIVIQRVILHFQSDPPGIPLEASSDCGRELQPGESCDVNINIMPTSAFMQYSNVFDVEVRFRATEKGVLSKDDRHDKFDPQSYIRVLEPARKIGKVFISLKQPEDLRLGHLVRDMARRAGMEPILKADNQRPGEDFWQSLIEPELRASAACFVIWTRNTDRGAPGVQREITFCRKNGIREIPLLEQGIIVPHLYVGATEYVQFDWDSPGESFAKVVDSFREYLVRISVGQN